MSMASQPRQTWAFRKLRVLTQWLVGLRIPNLGSAYLSYHPDSYTMVQGHPEFRALLRGFTRFNRSNNGGDMQRLWTFMLNVKQILAENVPGDFAELGVWRGNTAGVLAHYAQAAGRKVALFDTFEGFDQRDMQGVDASRSAEFSDTSERMVRQVIGAAACVCEFVQGRFPDSLRPEHHRRYALVSLDCDLHEPMRAGLEFFYEHLSVGGLLLVHDYGNPAWPGVKLAADEFCARMGEHLIVVGDKSGSALIRKKRSPEPGTAPRG